MNQPRPQTKLIAALGIVVTLLTLFSGIEPYDRMTWVMEVAPIFIALPILLATYNRFPLTSFLYVLIAFHAIILAVGGKYTYARVPLGYWIQDWFSLTRNPYDKIGHFAQGFMPALITREILIRGNFVAGRKMVAFLCVCVVLAISATYELVEWGAALWLGQGADEFLGTQGYEWDTQSDMFFALIGSVVALTALSNVHDRFIKRLVGQLKAKSS